MYRMSSVCASLYHSHPLIYHHHPLTLHTSRLKSRSCVCVTSYRKCGASHNRPSDCALHARICISARCDHRHRTWRTQKSHAGLLTPRSWDRACHGTRLRAGGKFQAGRYTAPCAPIRPKGGTTPVCRTIPNFANTTQSVSV